MTCNFFYIINRRVESHILFILRQRFEDCVIYEGPDSATKCKPLHDDLKKGEENWFIKCEFYLFIHIYFIIYASVSTEHVMETSHELHKKSLLCSSFFALQHDLYIILLAFLLAMLY